MLTIIQSATVVNHCLVSFRNLSNIQAGLYKQTGTTVRFAVYYHYYNAEAG